MTLKPVLDKESEPKCLLQVEAGRAGFLAAMGWGGRVSSAVPRALF